LVAPDGSARFGKATPIRAVARGSRSVPLRFTSRDPRRASRNRGKRVQEVPSAARRRGGVRQTEAETAEIRHDRHGTKYGNAPAHRRLEGRHGGRHRFARNAPLRSPPPSSLRDATSPPLRGVGGWAAVLPAAYPPTPRSGGEVPSEARRRGGVRRAIRGRRRSALSGGGKHGDSFLNSAGSDTFRSRSRSELRKLSPYFRHPIRFSHPQQNQHLSRISPRSVHTPPTRAHNDRS
jgi:hypothetical protein